MANFCESKKNLGSRENCAVIAHQNFIHQRSDDFPVNVDLFGIWAEDLTEEPITYWKKNAPRDKKKIPYRM